MFLDIRRRHCRPIHLNRLFKVLDIQLGLVQLFRRDVCPCLFDGIGVSRGAGCKLLDRAVGGVDGDLAISGKLRVTVLAPLLVVAERIGPPATPLWPVRESHPRPLLVASTSYPSVCRTNVGGSSLAPE